jgi:cytidylate kinase
VSAPRTIAIDGPAGSGKSAVGLWLAHEMSYAYLDTGALYRAITWLALREQVPVDDGPTLARLVEQFDVRVVPPRPEDAPHGYTLLVDGEPITAQLFTPRVNDLVSPVSAHPPVRAAILPLQRRIAEAGRVVMVGRDIGTVVMPNADLKLYLDAPVEERARRRWTQERERGSQRSFEDVLADVRQRDEIDSSRAAAPLRAAPDARVLDTEKLTLAETTAAVRGLIGELARR